MLIIEINEKKILWKESKHDFSKFENFYLTDWLTDWLWLTDSDWLIDFSVYLIKFILKMRFLKTKQCIRGLKKRLNVFLWGEGDAMYHFSTIFEEGLKKGVNEKRRKKTGKIKKNKDTFCLNWRQRIPMRTNFIMPGSKVRRTHTRACSPRLSCVFNQC